MAAFLSLVLPLADAPNPAACPHHQCNYHPITGAGVAVLAIVGIVAVVLVLLLTVALMLRHRRRKRRLRAGST